MLLQPDSSRLPGLGFISCFPQCLSSVAGQNLLILFFLCTSGFSGIEAALCVAPSYIHDVSIVHLLFAPRCSHSSHIFAEQLKVHLSLLTSPWGNCHLPWSPGDPHSGGVVRGLVTEVFAFTRTRGGVGQGFGNPFLQLEGMGGAGLALVLRHDQEIQRTHVGEQDNRNLRKFSEDKGKVLYLGT